MSLATFILLLVFLINLGLLLFILSQGKYQRRRWPIFTMIFLIVLWEATELLNLAFFQQNNFWLTISVRAGLLPTLYLAPAFVWLVLSLFDQWKTLSKWRKIWLWLPAIVMSLFVFTRYNASNIFIYGNQVIYTAGVIYWYFAIYFAALMVFGLYWLIKNRRHAYLIVKRQIDYIFAGTALAALGGLVFSMILPVLGVNSVYYIGADSIIFFTTIVTYALFRSQFFDLKISIYRTVIDILRLLITGSIFYVIYFILARIVGIDFSLMKNFLILIIFIALTSPLIFRLANKAVIALLANPGGENKEIVNRIADILRSSRDLDILFSRLARQIHHVIDYKEIFIYLVKRKDTGVFYQVFPVGERLLELSGSRLLQFLDKEHKPANFAEIQYFESDRELAQEMQRSNIDIALPIFYNRQLLGALVIDAGHELLTIQKTQFLTQVNKYLDIAVGSLLLHQQDMAEKIK